MPKTRRAVSALLCALCLLIHAMGVAEPSRTIRNVMGRIEQGGMAMMGEMLLVPENCSGFELQYRPEVPGELLKEILPEGATEAVGDNGIVRCPLDEDTVRWLLENAYALSIAPDGSILWIIYFDSGSVMFLQRQKALVVLTQSRDRGAPDASGSLKSTLDHKMNIASEAVEGEVRWSPDSRYLFFCDTERWHGVPDDPYLADTRTGEIFLVENGGYPKDVREGAFRCIMDGRFSMDGKSFLWYCRTYAPDTPPAHSLMRYDLESGAQETVCELKGALKDFCEVKENRWFLLEEAGDGLTLARVSFSPEGIERTEESLSISWKSCEFFPVVRGNVLLAVTPLSSGGTYLLPLTWDEPAASVWRKISSIQRGSLEEISAEEIEAEVREVKSASRGISANEAIGAANIKDAAAINGVTNLLLTVYIREPVPDSWGGGFRDFNGQVILNTENLKLIPVQTAWTQDGLRDSLIDGTCFLFMGSVRSALGLFASDTLPEVSFIQGETYSSPFGSFMCRNEHDPLVLSSVTLENRECTADISAMETGYRIDFRIVSYPEPETVRREFAVPEVLTANRWKEVTSAMNKKEQKKFSALYTKMTPEKLAERKDRDEILACYPPAAAEPLYILIGDIKAAALESAEASLAAAGYTAEDYLRDMESVAVSRETNVLVTTSGRSDTYPVRYAFSASDPALFPDSTRVQELAGLCDRIGSAVMANICSAEPLPLEEIIQRKYDMKVIDFHVTIDRSETTEDTLAFSLTVTP